MSKLCAVCLKSDILCSGCQKNLEKGKISNTDIAVSRALTKLDVAVNYVKVVEDEKSIIIIADRENAGAIIGRRGKNTKQLSQTLVKEVRVIENANNKQMIEKIARTQVIGINIVYPDGKYRIRMHKTRLHVSTELLSAILGKNVEIIFE